MLDHLRLKKAELETERAAAIEAMESATTAATTEERSLTPEEDVAFTEARDAVIAADAAIDDVDAQIVPLEQIEARTAVIAKRAPFNVNPGRTREDPYGEVRTDATTSEIRGRVEMALDAERGIDQEQQGQVQRLVETLDRGERNGDKLARHIIATGRPAYRTAFGKVMSNHPESLTPEESHAMSEVRAASLTTTAGGFAVPYVIDTTIIDTNAGSVNPMRQLATIKQIMTNKWTGVTSAGVTASWDGEAAEVSDDAPTLAQPVIEAEKAQMFVPASIEIFEDWAGMESDIRTMFAQAKDNLEATAHFTGAGTGSSQPTGIITSLDGGASEVAPATGETFAVADVYALENALPAKHRQNASFTANKSIYNLVRQMDANGGSDMWERIGAGTPSQLLGYNAYEASAMDGAFDAAATADNFILLLGDFKNYVVVDRVGLSVELVPHLFATANNLPSGQRGLFGYFRSGGGCVNIDAFRLLNVATAA